MRKRNIINEDSNGSSTSTSSSTSSSSSSSKKQKSSFFQLCKSQVSKKQKSSFFQLCKSQLKTPDKPHADISKTSVYLRIFWKTEDEESIASTGGATNSNPQPHTRCVGCRDKIMGIMISNMGSLYGMLVSNEICSGIANPLHYQGSQFAYLSAAKRTEMIVNHNSHSQDDDISSIPKTLELRYGAFIGHTCSVNESKMELLQLHYAQLVDVLQEHVHNMEDPEKECNGIKSKISRQNSYNCQ